MLYYFAGKNPLGRYNLRAKSTVTFLQCSNINK